MFKKSYYNSISINKISIYLDWKILIDSQDIKNLILETNAKQT